MPKDDDFGGLPQTVFVPLVRDVQIAGAAGPLGLTNPADQVAILAALAIAEHASASSTRTPNSYDYSAISEKIDNLIAKIRTQSGPMGTDVADLLTEITNYQNLWA
jgi:hypothetical protein